MQPAVRPPGAGEGRLCWGHAVVSLVEPMCFTGRGVRKKGHSLGVCGSQRRRSVCFR